MLGHVNEGRMAAPPSHPPAPPPAGDLARGADTAFGTGANSAELKRTLVLNVCVPGGDAAEQTSRFSLTNLFLLLKGKQFISAGT